MRTKDEDTTALFQAVVDALPEPAPEDWRGNRKVSCGERTAKQLRDAWTAVEKLASKHGLEVDGDGRVECRKQRPHTQD